MSRSQWVANFWKKLLSESDRPLTTGVGSLPHANIDAALGYAFRFAIPFCPQVPLRNPREYMIGQALELLPGLQLGPKGEATLNRSAWERGQETAEKKIATAFDNAAAPKNSFAEFAPSSEAYSHWKPFLWEVSERKVPVAKVQLAGPMTSQWSLRFDDGTPADRSAEVGTLIFRLCLARSIAMAREVKATGAVPLFFIDEPGFYGFTRTNPKHILGLQELRLFIQALQKEGVVVGIHCCSNTDWRSVFSLNLDVLSMDATLSLPLLLREGSGVKEFLASGGKLSLGMIPTAKGGEELKHYDVLKAVDAMQITFADNGWANAGLLRELLSESIFTPACGLGLHSVEDAEIILSYLEEFVQEALKVA